jgi:hypothetical protein
MLELSDKYAWEGERKKAFRLEELTSPSGMPYIKDESISHSPFFELFYARTEFEDCTRHHPEVAYWCSEEKLWIQGAPAGEPYDNISFLSGSAGLELRCRSCGAMLDKLVTKRS